jgi:hypothetical protein
MSVGQNGGVASACGAAINAAPALAGRPSDIFLYQVPTGLHDSTREWRSAAWSGWEKWPHPLMGQSATGRITRPSGGTPINGCIPWGVGYQHWTAWGHCRYEKSTVVSVSPLEHSYEEFTPYYLNDLFGRYDSYRLSVFAIRAYFFPCSYHDGSKYVVPDTFYVARYRKMASGLPAISPFKTCSWDFGTGWESCLGLDDDGVPVAGAPDDETVTRSVWPQRIYNLMAGPEAGPMTTHDSGGCEYDHKPAAWLRGVGSHWCTDDGCGHQTDSEPIYGLNHGQAGQSFEAQSGISASCLRSRVIPPGARHTLCVVARIWKRRARKGQKSSTKYCYRRKDALGNWHYWGEDSGEATPWYADGSYGALKANTPWNGSQGPKMGASGTQGNVELYCYADMSDIAPNCGGEVE